ncbi:hypothetical protein R70723_00905 [Paenibacillus sp. FSL R7-0273]|uniref:YesK family protein n=1 Tax=Paenibacillus sp. FSL R7-0273 TaxID=1536772 RepID=UPI0004F5B667|nr:hypothetical protein R70723_00905 [Paenibacillus sp. FSL R7-0273]OMF88231.1 hypothetical protein BK144_22135 [Paenibacillus sp. FSL R7-0273]
MVLLAGILTGLLIVFISLFLSRDHGWRRRLIYYPAITGLAGGVILLVLSFLVIRGWEGIAYAFFAAPVIIISAIILLTLALLRSRA